MKWYIVLLLVSVFLCTSYMAAATPAEQKSANPYLKWEGGLSKDPGYFPIAVWLQDPAKAGKYKDIGINLYVGLWKGPTAEQIAALEQAGMPVICDQNAFALKYVREKKDNQTKADRTAIQRLQMKVKEGKFEQIEFKAVIDWLRQVSGLKIHVNWGALKIAGIQPTVPVKNVHLTNVTLEKALRAVLEDVGGATPLSYVVYKGVVTVSTKEDLSRPRYRKSLSIIVAWMHGDEPDNAQDFAKQWKTAEAVAKAWPQYAGRKWTTYGPPIPPAQIIADYQKIKKNDPTRPVMLNLGQGVAWDRWHGRGTRTNHPEDYPQYIKGGDIISYDIYPVNATHTDVKDKLWLVPFGVDRLIKWSKDAKVVWNVIECTQYGKGGRRPTPHEVKAQVWMSLVRGSRGLIYFVHEFAVKDAAGKVVRPFTGAGLLRDNEMAHAVGEINRRIHALGAVLNSPTLVSGAAVSSSNSEVPVAVMVKRFGGAVYLFAVAMRNGKTTATFKVSGVGPGASAEVLGEERTVSVKDGILKDAFKGYEVHLYKIK